MLPEILELMSIERTVQCPLREVGLPTTEGPFLLCDKSLKSKTHSSGRSRLERENMM